MSTEKAYSKMSDSEKKKEDWMNAKWRPMMGWMYMVVCITDFVVFPILWSLIQAAHGGRVESQWIPITLQGAGLFHIAMGAIIGVAAYGRTQEKLAGANNGGMQPAGMGGFGSSMGGFGSSGMGNMGSSNFGSPSSYNSPSSFGNSGGSNNSFAASSGSIGMSSSGKKMPPPADQPLL